MLPLIMAAIAAGPTFEVGEPPVLDDIGPLLRQCEANDRVACGTAADFAAKHGHFRMAETLSQRSCEAGEYARCEDVVDLCKLGVVAACREVEEAKDLPMPSGAALFEACGHGDRLACAYLEEHGLREVDATIHRWTQTKRAVPEDLLISPDGRTLLQASSKGAQYVRDGEVVGEIVLPADHRPVLAAGRWTPTELWFPLAYGTTLKGFYHNGRLEPVPDAWKDLPEGAECLPMEALPHVVFRRCRMERDRNSDRYRLFRMRPSGEVLGAFDLARYDRILGEGPQPGGLVVYARRPAHLFFEAGPHATALSPIENVGRHWRATSLTDAGRMLVRTQTEAALYPPAGEYAWSERLEDAEMTLSADGWIRFRRGRLLPQRRTTFRLRIEDLSGPRTPWFRADLLTGVIWRIQPHPLGFFVQAQGRGAVVRAPWRTRPAFHVQPEGRLQGIETDRWPKPERTSDSFRADPYGWPSLGRRLAPDEGEVRPKSRRMQDVPGLQEALRACADGSLAACETIQAAAPLPGIGPVLRAIRGLKCDHFRPHRCPPPDDERMPPEFKVQHNWRWDELGVSGARVVDVGWENGTPVVWATGDPRGPNEAWLDETPVLASDGGQRWRRVLDTTPEHALVAYDGDVVAVGRHAAHLPHVRQGWLRSDGGVVLRAYDAVVGWQPGKARAVVTPLPWLQHGAASPSRRTVAVVDASRRVYVVDVMRGKVTFTWQAPEAPPGQSAYVSYTREDHLLVCDKSGAWAGPIGGELKPVDRAACGGRIVPRGERLWSLDRMRTQPIDGRTLEPSGPEISWTCGRLVEDRDGVLCASEHYLTWFGATPRARPTPIVRAPSFVAPDPSSPWPIEIPTRAVKVDADGVDAPAIRVRFDDGVIRTFELGPNAGLVAVPYAARAVEVVEPAGLGLHRQDAPHVLEIGPVVRMKLQVFGPDGAPATRVRVLGLEREIEGGHVVDLGRFRDAWWSKEVLVVDDAGNLDFVAFKTSSRPAPIRVRLHRPDSDRFTAIPVVGEAPDRPLLQRSDGFPMPRDAQGRVLLPPRANKELFYEVAPGSFKKARYEDGVFRLDAGVVRLQSPFPDVPRASFVGARLDGGQTARYAQTSTAPLDAPFDAGRWRLKVSHPMTGEVRWEDVEVTPGSTQTPTFPGRSRPIELTVLDQGGWPRPGRTKTDISGRRPWAPWQLVGAGEQTERVPGVEAPVRFLVPPGEGVLPVTVEVPIPRGR